MDQLVVNYPPGPRREPCAHDTAHDSLRACAAGNGEISADMRRRLEAGERSLIAAMARSERTLPARSVLQHQGDITDRIYRVVTGRAHRRRLLPDGRSQIVAILLPGDICGTSGLLGGKSRSAIEAETELCIQSLTQSEASRIVAQQPDVLSWLFQCAQDDMARTHRWLTVLSQGTATEKVATLLLDLHARYARSGNRDPLVAIPLTQREIADYVGLTAPHVSRLLTSLSRRGIVRLRYGAIEIAEPRGLAACAGNFGQFRVSDEAPPGPGKHRRGWAATIASGFSGLWFASCYFTREKLSQLDENWLDIFLGVA